MQIDIKYKSTVVDLTQMSEQVLWLLKNNFKGVYSYHVWDIS